MSPFITLPGNNAVHGAYVPIGTITADGTYQSAIFYNVPQIYQDLVIVHTLRSTNGSIADTISIQVNNTLNIYSDTFLTSNGASPTSNQDTNNYYGCGIGNTVGGFGIPNSYSTGVTHIASYANTSKYKTLLTLTGSDNGGSGYVTLVSSTIRTLSPLTQINVFTNSANIAAGSTVRLYGVRSIGQ
jgi:hypothetical protein